jgi:hypothetical protein
MTDGTLAQVAFAVFAIVIILLAVSTLRRIAKFLRYLGPGLALMGNARSMAEHPERRAEFADNLVRAFLASGHEEEAAKVYVEMFGLSPDEAKRRVEELR